MKKLVFGILAVVVIVATVVAGALYFNNSKDTDLLSYVTIEINPQVQLAVNEDNEVVEVIALNDDADIVTSGLALVGLSVEEATDAILESATETGYIDEFGEANAVTITAYSDDEEKREEIEDSVIERAKDVLERKEIIGQVVSGLMTDELKAEAADYGISNGKMLLVAKAYALNNTLNKEELVNLSVKEIQAEIKEVVQNRYEERTMTKEEFKNYAQEQKQVRKQETTERLNEIIDEVTEENQDRVEQAGEAQKQKVIEQLLKEKKAELRKKVSNGNTGKGNSSAGGQNSNR